MTSEIDKLSKQEIIDKINNLDLLIVRIRDEIYENNNESNKDRLKKLREKRKELEEQRDMIG